MVATAVKKQMKMSLIEQNIDENRKMYTLSSLRFSAAVKPTRNSKILNGSKLDISWYKLFCSHVVDTPFILSISLFSWIFP